MKRKLAIVAGGDSGEYDISIKSGRVVMRHIDRSQYEPWFVVIHGHEWYAEAEDGGRYPVDRNDFSVTMGYQKITFDIVFNSIHGTPGENGLLQAYFELTGIAYTSCDPLVAALTFNKNLCKQWVVRYGASVAASVILRKGEEVDTEHIFQTLGYPVFVKPNSNGSSVGVSKVKQTKDLAPALDSAFAVDDEVMVEAFMPGREITCGVLRDAGKLVIFPVTEIKSKNEFFDYQAKYEMGMSEEIVPADIPDSVAEHCQLLSGHLYEQLRCKGVVRFDYIFDENRLQFLEVNTVPGFTEASIVPKMANAYGWSLQELFGTILANA